MWLLHHYPLCPFSRKIRFLLAEKAIPFELRLEYPWDQRETFLNLNPAGQTPVLENPERQIALADSGAIAEYLEEIFREPLFIGAGPAERAEVRRLVAWFDQQFYAEAGHMILHELMYKRLVSRSGPDPTILRHAHQSVDRHLDYLAYLLDHRRWLGGVSFSLADMAAAAHISVVDYLGAIDWKPHDQVRQWYSAVKSRPAFRPVLADMMEGLRPAAHYSRLDF